MWERRSEEYSKDGTTNADINMFPLPFFFSFFKIFPRFVFDSVNAFFCE